MDGKVKLTYICQLAIESFPKSDYLYSLSGTVYNWD